MTALRWWLRIVGLFYVLQAVSMVFVRAPIQAAGPPGALEVRSCLVLSGPRVPGAGTAYDSRERSGAGGRSRTHRPVPRGVATRRSAAIGGPVACHPLNLAMN